MILFNNFVTPTSCETLQNAIHLSGVDLEALSVYRFTGMKQKTAEKVKKNVMWQNNILVHVVPIHMDGAGYPVVHGRLCAHVMDANLASYMINHMGECRKIISQI